MTLASCHPRESGGPEKGRRAAEMEKERGWMPAFAGMTGDEQ